MNTAELAWFKSSYSDAEGGNCIEVAYDWRKSSYSSGEGGQCIEVAYDWESAHPVAEGGPAAVRVRDSKVPHGPQLAVTPGAWASFVTYVER